MFIAKKPCSFGPNHNYLIGENIPDGVVAPDAVKRLTKMGIIVEVEVEAESDAPSTMDVSVDGTTVELTQDGLQKLVDVLSANAEDATERIKELDNMDLLFLVNATDSRKTVQAAAKARAQALNEAQEGEESAGDQ